MAAATLRSHHRTICGRGLGSEPSGFRPGGVGATPAARSSYPVSLSAACVARATAPGACGGNGSTELTLISHST